MGKTIGWQADVASPQSLHHDAFSWSSAHAGNSVLCHNQVQYFATLLHSVCMFTVAGREVSRKGCEQTCARKGPRARAPGAMNGEKNGIASVAGLLLNDMRMLPALLVLA